MQKAETEWKRLNHSPGKSPISGQKRNARKRVPAASIRKVAFRIKPAIRMIPPTWGGGDGLLHEAALPQADALAREQRDCDSRGDHAHTARLDEQKDHRLPKLRPVGDGIVQDEPGDTW